MFKLKLTEIFKTKSDDKIYVLYSKSIIKATNIQLKCIIKYNLNSTI